MIEIETIKHAIWLLLALQVKHAICDGPLQTLQMVREKSSYGKRWGLVHALIHATASIAILMLAGVPIVLVLQLALLEFVLHYHIDFIKESFVNHRGWYHSDGPFWWALVVDQTLHHMSYVALVWLVITA